MEMRTHTRVTRARARKIFILFTQKIISFTYRLICHPVLARSKAPGAVFAHRTTTGRARDDP